MLIQVVGMPSELLRVEYVDGTLLAGNANRFPMPHWDHGVVWVKDGWHAMQMLSFAFPFPSHQCVCFVTPLRDECWQQMNCFCPDSLGQDRSSLREGFPDSQGRKSHSMGNHMTNSKIQTGDGGECYA